MLRTKKGEKPVLCFIFDKMVLRCLQCFFRFGELISDRILGLTQANFEANSADFLHITQNFGIFDQKLAKIGLTNPKF